MIHWIPYLLIACAVAVLAGWWPRLTRHLAILCIEMAGLAEAIIGVRQIFGLALSRHAMFSLTGTFDNPGPLGGFLAVASIVSICDAVTNRAYLVNPFRAEKESRPAILAALFAAGCAAICLIPLPATMSRTAWIAAAAGASVYALEQVSVRNWLKHHSRLMIPGILLVSILLGGVFFLKKESAIGRLHIWHMELLAIREKPLSGWGFGHEMGAYGIVQHDYFARGGRHDVEIKMAGCPEYPFNEYLGLAIAGGIPLLLLALGAGALCIIRLGGSPLCYGAVTLAVFAFASYPMSQPLLRAVLAILLGAALAPNNPAGWKRLLGLAILCIILTGTLMTAKRRKAWQEAQDAVSMLSFSKTGDYYSGLADALGEYYPVLQHDFRYLYEYGLALHKEGAYEHSLEVLRRGVEYSCDPMFHNIIGKNLQAMGEFEEAEEAYRYASFQVPCRLYPHLLLIRLYQQTGRYDAARKEAELALSLPVNPRNRAMQGIREQILQENERLKI